MEDDNEALRRYADIFFRPHHRSAARKPMPMSERAAQFSPYDALTGYSDMIAEEARFTESEQRSDENALERLNEKLALIAQAAARGERPVLRFTVFLPDGRKAGGRYVTVTEAVHQVDTVGQRVVLEKKQPRTGIREFIPFERIAAVSGSAVDAADEPD